MLKSGMNLASEWLARLFLLLQQNQHEFKSLDGRGTCPQLPEVCPDARISSGSIPPEVDDLIQ